MLANWFLEKRKEKGINLVELAQRSGLTQSTLSRIETQQSQITLFTAVRVMHALDLPWTELFIQGLVKKDLPIPEIYCGKDQQIPDFPCLVPNDFDILDSMGLMTRGVAPAIVTHLLGLFIKKYDPALSKEKIDLLAPNFYSLLNTPASKDGIARQHLPNVDFQYPQDFPPALLRNIYLLGGTFILPDLGRYVRHLRETRQLSLRDMAIQVELSHPTLSNFETNPGDKVRLNDIIHLDNVLELNGELVVFAWRTAELYIGVHRIKTGLTDTLQPWQSLEIHLIEKLITTSRLFQRYFPDDRQWLDWYRGQSLSGFGEMIR